MRLTSDNQSQKTLLEAVRIGGALVGLVLLSACSMNGTSQASYIVSVDAARVGQSRPVVVRRMLENLAVVDQGLAAGDVVVAEAPLDLIPGTRVRVRETGFSGAE